MIHWLLCSMLWTIPRVGEVPAPKEQKPLPQVVESLVRDLGSESYERREAASKALRRIGLPAVAALEKAAKSDDPEVRMRVRRILTDVRLGITEDWPSDIAYLARRYEYLTEFRQKRHVMERISQILKDRAVSFLVIQMASGTGAEAECALSCLKKMDSDRADQKVVQLIKEPKNKHEEQALALARKRMQERPESAPPEAAEDLREKARRQMIEAAIRRVLSLLGEGKYQEAADIAAQFAKSAKSEARLLYLQAEALLALGGDARAGALRRQALTRNRRDEAPHYKAGEMLMELGRRRLAVNEYGAILRIPPVGAVYDINAHLRLARIYEACNMFQSAADSLGRALQCFANARDDGQAVGIVGGTETTIRAQVAQLQERARRFPAGPHTRVTDELGEQELHVAVSIQVKEGKEEQLLKELAAAAATLSMNVGPEGLRIFDVAPASLTYDRERKHLTATLNGKPFGKPIPFQLKGEKARVAVNTVDCCYLFEIDATTSQATKVARFEKDYVIKLEPGIKFRALKDVVATLNGKKYAWAELLKGVSLDLLPKTLEISLEGTNPKGRRIKTSAKLNVTEPVLRPVKGPGSR